MGVLSRDRWFLNPGSLSSWIDQFLAELGSQGYTPLTIASYGASARHFAVWLENAGLTIGDVDDGVVRRFAEHQCRCLGSRRWQCVSPKYARRQVRLPLPQDVGDALLAYIEQERPLVAQDAVFLMMVAPYRFGLLRSHLISLPSWRGH